MWEVRCQKWDVESWKSDVGSGESWKWEVRSGM